MSNPATDTSHNVPVMDDSDLQKALSAVYVGGTVKSVRVARGLISIEFEEGSYATFVFGEGSEFHWGPRSIM